MNNQLIKSSDDLTRAVIISLFTWRRAEDSDPVDDDERYGFWGDSFPDVPKDKIGSRLWLLRRRSITTNTVNDAKRYAKEALAWLVEDEIVEKVDVRVLRNSAERIDLVVVLTIDDEQKEFDFSDVLGVINAI